MTNIFLCLEFLKGKEKQSRTYLSVLNFECMDGEVADGEVADKDSLKLLS